MPFGARCPLNPPLHDINISRFREVAVTTNRKRRSFKELTDMVSTRVERSAIVLGFHPAVAWFEGVSGCYAIDRVRADQRLCDSCRRADTSEPEMWRRDLIAADWKEESMIVWRAPDGGLWRGPYGAWRELQRRNTTRPLLQPRENYHEDLGNVFWWHLPIEEPPHFGSPLNSDWQENWDEYYTHWSLVAYPVEAGEWTK